MSALNDVAAIENFRLISGVLSQATNALKGFASQALQSYSHFEQMESSLQGVMRDTQKGTELFERLRKFSFDTTFGVDTLANASSQLLNTGTTMAELEPTLLQIGNIAQGDTNKFNELVSVFTKINNTGKASSVQLQQLALRGVPIYQVLKQIGVTGTATSKDIKKAFEVMTTSGGQFEGAMERINNTIQGKEGFISDTWREFLTSFSEASGLADAYKSALDTVYDALQDIVDWLLKINENPVAQAFFSGAVVALVVGIGGALIGSLVPALATVISQMTVMVALKTALAGPVGWIALGVGALVGVGVALSKSIPKAEKEVKKLSGSVESFIADVSDVKMSIEDATGKINEWDDSQAFSTDAIDAYRLQLNSIATQIQDIYDSYGLSDVDWMNDTSYDSTMFDGDIDMVNKLKASYNDYLEKYNHVTAAIGSQNVMLEKQNEILKRNKSIVSQVESIRAEADELWANSPQNQKAELEDKISKIVRNYGGTKVTDVGGHFESKEVRLYNPDDAKEKAKFDYLLAQYKQELAELNSQLLSDSRPEWEKFFESYTGIALDRAHLAEQNAQGGSVWLNTATAKDNNPDNDYDWSLGSVGVLDWIESLEKKMNNEKFVAESLGEEIDDAFNAEHYQDIADQLRGFLQEALDSGLYEEGEQSVQLLIRSIADFENRAKEASENLNKTNRELLTLSQRLSNDMTEALNKYMDAVDANDKNAQKGALKEYAGASIGSGLMGAISGTDLGTFAESTAKSGSWIVGLIDSVAGALAKIVQSSESFGTVMNFLTEWLNSLKPVLDWLFNLLADFVNAVSAVFKIFSALFQLLSPIFEAVSAIFKVLIYPLKVIASLLVPLAKWLEGWVKGVKDFFENLFGWTDDLDEYIYEKSEEEQNEIERLRKLNEQYANLSKAIEEQQQYYLAERKKINAETMYDRLAFRDVNDMIITPQGVFNTSPQDTIMAMKHPESLIGGGNVSITINNTMADSANVSAQKGSDGQIFITISKKIASDYATGANGWDRAIQAHDTRISGRRVLA